MSNVARVPLRAAAPRSRARPAVAPPPPRPAPPPHPSPPHPRCVLPPPASDPPPHFFIGNAEFDPHPASPDLLVDFDFGRVVDQRLCDVLDEILHFVIPKREPCSSIGRRPAVCRDSAAGSDQASAASSEDPSPAVSLRLSEAGLPSGASAGPGSTAARS